MPPSATPSGRLLALSGLAIVGLVCASTAATVYAVAVPRRAAAHAATALAEGHDWRAAADLTDGVLVRTASDPRLDADTRLAAVQDIVYGACLSPGEMLLGARAARHVALRDAMMGTRGVPGAPTVAATARRALVAFDQGDALSIGATGSATGTTNNGELARRLSLVLPVTIEHRLALCEAVRPR